MVIITSGIDLSIGSIMALGAMVGGTILKNNQAVPGVVIILVSIAVGIVCGFINGTLVAKLKILPIIATLGMMNIYRGLTYLVANGSWVKQQEMGTKFLSIATGKFLGINKFYLMLFKNFLKLLNIYTIFFYVNFKNISSSPFKY